MSPQADTSRLYLSKQTCRHCGNEPTLSTVFGLVGSQATWHSKREPSLIQTQKWRHWQVTDSELEKALKWALCWLGCPISRQKSGSVFWCTDSSAWQDCRNSLEKWVSVETKPGWREKWTKLEMCIKKSQVAHDLLVLIKFTFLCQHKHFCTEGPARLQSFSPLSGTQIIYSNLCCCLQCVYFSWNMDGVREIGCVCSLRILV